MTTKQSNKRTKYVVGFVFSVEFQHILLIKKRRPDFLAGYWNGVGGKVETDELLFPLEAMVRECKEEVGLHIPHDKWTHLCVVDAPNAHIDFFYTISGIISDARQCTDEKINVVKLMHTDIYNLVPNLFYMLPLAKFHASKVGGTAVKLPVHFIEE